MFSKPMLPFIEQTDGIIENVVISNESVKRSRKKVDKPMNLDKCKQTTLKDILREYKTTISFRQTSIYTYRRYSAKDIRKIKALYDFALSGNKKMLMDRVTRLYDMESASMKIQKLFRGYIVREIFRLRGPALKNRNICVNETDFYTLEPIKNIHVNDFFSYKGEKNFIYGFDMDSIVTLFKNKQRAMNIVNPYNREYIDVMRVTIEKLTRFTMLIDKNRDKIEHKPATVKTPTPQRLIYGLTDLSGNAIRNHSANLDELYDVNEMIEKLRAIRESPVQNRTENLFMEIDQLGNYAQSTWFSQLNRRDLIRFFRSLYDIWYYRAQIPFDIKRKICPLVDPFISILNEPIRYNDISEGDIKLICLNVMEDMIYTGINNDFRTLGAFHVLCGLTLVSTDARTSMPWLYDSVVY
jgi:hypothetical protein